MFPEYLLRLADAARSVYKEAMRHPPLAASTVSGSTILFNHDERNIIEEMKTT